MTNRLRTQGTQSIRRALEVLNHLAVGRDVGVRLSDLCRSTGLSRPTAHRILRVLSEEGLVEHRPETRRYVIGDQVAILALARNPRLPLLRAAEPHLRQVAAKIGDAVLLTVRTGLDSVCLGRQLGSVRNQSWKGEVGARRPLGVSNAGIAILSQLTDEEAEVVLVLNRDRLPAYGVSEATVRRLVGEARARGYVVRDHGLVRGTKVVSVGMLPSRHSPAAALSVVGTDQRMTSRRVVEIRTLLQAHASEIVLALNRRERADGLTASVSAQTLELTR